MLHHSLDIDAAATRVVKFIQLDRSGLERSTVKEVMPMNDSSLPMGVKEVREA